LAILAVTGLASLVALSFARRKAGAAFAVCVLGLAAALAALGLGAALGAPASPSIPPETTAARWTQGLLSLDGLSVIGTAIALVSALAVALSSRPYLSRRESERGEYYVLLLFASLGAAVLAASSSLATVFLGLELLSVCLYALIGYRRERPEGTKAAFTYLILASAASAFLLFGMALAFFQTGSLELSRITLAIADGSGGALLSVGLGMMGVGFAFKLAIAPFHMWAPEVYEGAPAPVTALIASLSKVAMALPLVRVLAPAATGGQPAALWTLAVLSGLSMFAGNLIALREERVKRMLAGSSIAQLGYVLVALIAGGNYGTAAALFYLAAYAIASLAAFGCVAAISTEGRDASSREDFRGLSSRRPLVAAAMTAALLSLAGMPLTAGFVGKYLLFASSLGAGAATVGASASAVSASAVSASAASLPATRLLAVLLALNSAMSLFYYLRLVSLMYRGVEAGSPSAVEAAASGKAEAKAPYGIAYAGVALAALAAIIVFLGVAPGPAIDLIAAFTAR
jgi:NADH-quinone oxidoreductase subunit N